MNKAQSFDSEIESEISTDGPIEGLLPHVNRYWEALAWFHSLGHAKEILQSSC